MPAALALILAILLSAAASPAAALSARELQFLEDARTHAILHALPPREPGSTRNARQDECEPRSDLTAPGRLVASALGESLQKSGVRIDRLLAGPRCNAALTARLLRLVPVNIVPFLDAEPAEGTPEDQRDDVLFYLAGLRSSETALLVTHGQNIALLTGRETVPGEILIVRVSPLGELEVLFSLEP